MNKIILTFFSSILCFISIAQKDFKGIITYKIAYKNDLIDKEIQKSLPTEYKVSYLGFSTKTELKNNIGSSIVLAFADRNSTIILLEVDGNKFAINNSKEDRESLVKAIPETLIKFTDETKNILGYTCKKAELYQDDKVLEAWYTEDIFVPQVNWYTQFKHIKGVLLEYTQITNGIENRYIAKSVIKDKLKSKDFEVPEDYQVISKNEFDKFMKEYLSE